MAKKQWRFRCQRCGKPEPVMHLVADLAFCGPCLIKIVSEWCKRRPPKEDRHE